MSDLISRQAAKEAYCNTFCHPGAICPDGLCKEVNEAFDAVPSAEPELATDCISRQAAYETLSEYYHHSTEVQHQGLREALSRVPSAEQVRMKGWWATDSYGAMDDGEYLMTRCSVCGTAYEYGHDDRYCGFCGAEMSEGEEDENAET